MGCSDSVDQVPDSGDTLDSSVEDAGSDAAEAEGGYPGPHAKPPQVQNSSGPVLDAPHVIPIFFPNDPDQANIEDFLKQLAVSSFWGATTKEYGAGPLSIGSSIVVADTAPDTIATTGVQAWLLGYLDGGDAGSDAGWPLATQNNVFAIFYPSKTTIQDGTATSCTDFLGYHYSAVDSGGHSVVFAVLPRCPAQPDVSSFDQLTFATGHELIETATDPLRAYRAWTNVDTDHAVWNIFPGGEIADLCNYEPNSPQQLVGKYIVGRTWSNASATAGHDPCVPTLAQPYFSAAPVLTDSITLNYKGQSILTKGIQVPLGQSKTIDVQLFSDAPTSDWSLEAEDMGYFTGQPKQLNFAWDTASGNNGDVRHLTITRLANGPYQGTELIIFSEKATVQHSWYGFVGN